MADRSLLSRVGSAEHREVARQCVRESQVLLKKNDDILPLPKNNIKVLVAGEHADNLGFQCGGWTIQWGGASGDITEGTTILEGLQKVAPDVDFVFDAAGNQDTTGADYAIVVVGEEPYAEGGGDRDDLSLNDRQIRLVRKIKKKGLPVITLLISGRPMIINSVLHNSDAVFASWLPGTEGDGIAQLLFGDYLPTGKLPMTWQKSMDHIPMNDGDEDYEALYPFGFGLTNYDNAAYGSAPVFNSALLTEDGRHIEVAFNKSMNNPANTDAQIYVLKNGSVSVGVDHLALSSTDEKMIILQLDQTVDETAALTISYTSGNLSAGDGGTLEYFTDQPVINFLKYTVGTLQIPGKIEAEDYTDMYGVQTENSSDVGGGLNVGWIDDGDWMDYNCQVQSNGRYVVNLRVASQSNGGTLKLLVDGTEQFTHDLPVTDGWQNWTTVSNFVNLQEGSHTIRLLAEEGGFNINWFEFLLTTGLQNNNRTPQGYELGQNYPNPFNPVTTIPFFIPQKQKVVIHLYDVAGNRISRLLNDVKSAGNHAIKFDAGGLSSGIYFYKLSAGHYQKILKLVLLK